MILEIENNHFKTKKLNVQEEPKNGHLLKGLIHRFCPNIEISLIAVFCKIMSEKIVFDILERKQSFLDEKIEVLTRAKKWTFFKGVCPWILSKFQTFSYRCFLQKSYQKRSFLILWKEKNDFK